MELSFWSTDLNRPSVELIANEAKRFGFAEEKPERGRADLERGGDYPSAPVRIRT